MVELSCVLVISCVHTHRDQMTADDIVGTEYIQLSHISALGNIGIVLISFLPYISDLLFACISVTFAFFRLTSVNRANIFLSV
jgi:hypothetical protein